MHYELLTSLFSEVFLVNCEVKDKLVTAGAVYINPMLKQSLLRFKSPDKATVDIRLPDEFLNNPGEGKAYGATLEVVNHEPPPDGSHGSDSQHRNDGASGAVSPT